MDVDEEDGDDDGDSDEVDSIMDEDEPESSRAEEGGDDDSSAHQVDGESTQQQSKKSGRKSDLSMAALTDEQAALAALESNQLLHLRLRKRYYAEALNFIRQVEEAAQMIFQLLGSTHKAEVLEAMEFFRVAHEYQLDSAEVGGEERLGQF
jgi:condensin complex subunit 1